MTLCTWRSTPPPFSQCKRTPPPIFIAKRCLKRLNPVLIDAIYIYTHVYDIHIRMYNFVDPEVHPQPEEYWGHVNPIGPRACYDEGKRVAETMCYAYANQVVDQRIVL